MFKLNCKLFKVLNVPSSPNVFDCYKRLFFLNTNTLFNRKSRNGNQETNESPKNKESESNNAKNVASTIKCGLVYVL